MQKLQTLKCDILSNFQTLCQRRIYTMQYSKTNSIYRESQQLIWVIYGETDKSAEAAKMPQKLNFAFFFQGNCSDFTERFYFDSSLGRCQAFIFRGCQGNGNNFLTMNECENHCRHLLRYVEYTVKLILALMPAQSKWRCMVPNLCKSPCSNNMHMGFLSLLTQIRLCQSVAHNVERI